MQVAIHLRRRPEGGPAVALLLPSRDVAGVLSLCARFALDPCGRVFDVDGGFLIRLAEASMVPFPGAVRLRGLAANLFLPVDADLVPALLDDEAEGLTRSNGLIVLPGGRVLGFEPDAALPLPALLAGASRPRRAWHPLPSRGALAERIGAIHVVPPDESPETVLDAGAGEIGTEEPRPEAAGPASTIAGRAAMTAGQALDWLGRSLGLEGLARLGTRWIGGAMDLAPRLSEAMLGRQDAALRALLREFREGDLERALRRALPLGGVGAPRGGVVETSDRLPTHRTNYSLGDLIGASGGGPASIWSGGRDVMAELAGEYRKAAARAIREGDFRRAAFIHGRLLRDYRAAAHALIRGGLHHDAAVLLLARLDDRRGAALAFEAAGELDRALALYRTLGDHVAAGDLLRKIGEEDDALAEYALAAVLLALSGPEGGHLAAGELLLKKVGACDQARAHFATGWSGRPGPNAVPCALQLLRLDLEAGDVKAARPLLDEADAFFAVHGDLPQAGRFYGELAVLAGLDVESVAAAREELSDRALLGIAGELRARATPGASASELVAILSRRPDAWPAVVTSDASFAIAAATRPPAPPSSTTPAKGHDPRRLRVGHGTVTAFCAAPGSGEVFVGFSGGEIYVVRPERAEIARVAEYDLTVTAMAVCDDGKTLLTLRSSETGRGVISTFERRPDGSYRTMLGTVLAMDGSAPTGLTPILSQAGGDRVGLWSGRELHILSVSSLTWERSLTPRTGSFSSPILLLPWPRHDDEGYAAFAHDGGEWTLFDTAGDVIQRTGHLWRPSLSQGSPLHVAPVSGMSVVPDHLEVAGVGEFGTLHWAAFHAGDGRLDRLASCVATESEGGYLAATLVRSGLVAGVTRSRIDWLHAGSGKFSSRAPTRIALPSAIACLPNRRSGDLIVLCADGQIVRVPLAG